MLITFNEIAKRRGYKVEQERLAELERIKTESGRSRGLSMRESKPHRVEILFKVRFENIDSITGG